jgi:hypothetical protein
MKLKIHTVSLEDLHGLPNCFFHLVGFVSGRVQEPQPYSIERSDQESPGVPLQFNIELPVQVH